MIHNHPLHHLPNLFTREEIEKIIVALKNSKSKHITFINEFLKDRNVTICMTSYSCALRPAEVCKIRLNDLDLQNRILYVNPNSNKIRRGRPVPITDALYELLVYYLDKHKYFFEGDKNKLYLFPSLHNNHISRDSWSEIFKNALKKSGIWFPPRHHTHGHRSAYTLRHTKATEIYDKEKDIDMVADILGHNSWACTKVYVHASKLKSGYMDRMREALS